MEGIGPDLDEEARGRGTTEAARREAKSPATQNLKEVDFEMMRSLFSGVAGLRNHQLRMDIIGNNIANVNTVGYKKTRANFGEMLVQTLRGASAPQGGRGGSNAQQVGLGVTLSSVDSIFLQGSPQTTGKQTDLFIQGEGFFVLSDGADLLFTRAGNFDTDRDGNLIDKATGLKVMGWMADSSGNINTTTTVTGLNIPIGKTYPPTATSLVTYAGNLDAGAPAGTTKTTSIDIYDAQGAAHRVLTDFTKSATANRWNYRLSLDQGETLIQNFINTKYGTLFNTLTAADQATVVELANQVYLGGQASATSLGVASGPGIAVFADATNRAGTAGNSVQIQIINDGTAPAAANDNGAGNLVTVHTNGTATLADVVAALQNYIVAPADATHNRLIGSVMLMPGANGTTSATTMATPVTLSGGSDSSRGVVYGADATGAFQTSSTGFIQFTAAGILDSAGTSSLNGATPPNLTKNLIFTPQGTGQMEVGLDLKGLTQFFGGHSANAVRQNGNPPGTLQTVNVSADGTVSGVFSNGFSMGLGMLALANFNNPAGLLRVGDNMYKESANSGTRQVGTANTGGRGTVIPGALEMSNVDLAQEFTDMIMTQRGFQANTRVITVSDEMLNELANLKR